MGKRNRGGKDRKKSPVETTPAFKPPGPEPSQYPTTMPKEKILSGILRNPPLMGIEASLEQISFRVTPKLVEEVLKLSSGAGMEALIFFKWVSWKLHPQTHTPHAWNLMVDLLGKDKQFEYMWECIKVMRAEGILSMETISSVLGSYVCADKITEAMFTFEVIEQYGFRQDVTALNCLLSTLCMNNQTMKAQDFLDKMKEKISPNAISYTLLLQGWEKERNVMRARKSFGEMTFRFGWDPSNTLAYTAFLNTLINAHQVEEAIKVLDVMKGRQCLPDRHYFCTAIHALHQCRDTKGAYGLWEVMRQSGISPDTPTYNAMITVFCSANEFDCAYRLLDEMVFNGSFPDFKTYNTIFEALITKRKVEEASAIFREMTNNEYCPLYANYVMAIKMYFEADDPEMAVMMWRHMMEKGVGPKADCASVLIDGFCDLKRVSEAQKYCEEAIGKGIQVPSETMKKLRDALVKEGKRETYEQLEKKLRSFSRQAKR